MASQPPLEWKTQQCPECGTEFRRSSGRGGVKTFCTAEHKKAYQARAAAEGRAIIALAKAWRECRNRKEDGPTGSAALAEMVSILDSFNAADRKAGRPRTTEYVKRQLRSGYRYMDRKRG
jgi:hypothetical protein